MNNSKFIKKKQIEKLKNFKKKIVFLKEKNIDVTLSSICYPCTWYKNFGYYNFKYEAFPTAGNFLKKIIFFFKDVFLVSIITNYKLKINNNFQRKSKILLISWGGKENFNKNGVFIDRKFLNYQRQKILVIGSSFFDKKIFNKVNF